MHGRIGRIPPALKHGAYSATSVLPGESRAAFEKLHRNLKAEWSPSGALEDDIVMTYGAPDMAQAKSYDFAHCRECSKPS